MRILYFSWVRDRVGLAEEEVSPPAGVVTAADLIEWLKGRGEGHALAFADTARIRVAIDQDHAPLDGSIAGAREVAFFPPVTGGAPGLRVTVQEQPINVAGLLAGFAADDHDAGGIATFQGRVRHEGGKLSTLTLEHYPGMTERQLRAIAEEAARRWELSEILLVHRHGTMRPGETIVLVATAARHRAAALESCGFLIDWLKTKAPFWKREEGEDGAGWVEARAEDDAATARWTISRG